MTTNTNNNNNNNNNNNTSSRKWASMDTKNLVDALNDIIADEFQFVDVMNLAREVERASVTLKYGVRLRALADAAAKAEQIKASASVTTPDSVTTDTGVVHVCDMIMGAMNSEVCGGKMWTFDVPEYLKAREDEHYTVVAARDALLAPAAPTAPTALEEKVDRLTRQVETLVYVVSNMESKLSDVNSEARTAAKRAYEAREMMNVVKIDAVNALAGLQKVYEEKVAKEAKAKAKAKARSAAR